MSEPDQDSRVLGDPTRISTRVRDIQSITQISGSFQINPPKNAKPQRLAARLVGPESEVFRQDDEVVVILSLSFAGVIVGEADEQEPDPLIEIQATFSITYSVDGEVGATDQDYKAFAEINGMLNATPYWREYVQDSLSRAQLAPYYIPPFNVARYFAERDNERSASDEEGAR